MNLNLWTRKKFLKRILILGTTMTLQDLDKNTLIDIIEHLIYSDKECEYCINKNANRNMYPCNDCYVINNWRHQHYFEINVESLLSEVKYERSKHRKECREDI